MLWRKTRLMLVRNRKVPPCLSHANGTEFSLIGFLSGAAARASGSGPGSRDLSGRASAEAVLSRESTSPRECRRGKTWPRPQRLSQLRPCFFERRHASWVLHQRKTTAMTSKASAQDLTPVDELPTCAAAPLFSAHPHRNPPDPPDPQVPLWIPTVSENAMMSGPRSAFSDPS